MWGRGGLFCLLCVVAASFFVTYRGRRRLMGGGGRRLPRGPGSVIRGGFVFR